MKKKLNKKGFAMVETLICAVAVATMVAYLFNLILPMTGKASASENYEDLDTKYLAYYLKEMIETDTSIPNKITKVDKSNSADNNYYPFSSSCGELCKVYTTKSYKCETDTNGQCIVDSNGEIIYDDLNGNIFSTDTHYTNRNDLCNLLDSTKLSKNNMYYCNQFVNASHITNIYLINYYDTKSFKDYVKSNPKDSAGNLIFSNRSFRSYVSYMPRHNHADSKKDKLLLIVEQEHEATTEFGDKYYTYASIEVNRYGK